VLCANLNKALFLLHVSFAILERRNLAAFEFYCPIVLHFTLF